MRRLTALLLFAAAPAAAQQGLSERDRTVGAQEHPKLVAAFGGTYPGPQAAYVERVGQRIALQSGLAKRPGDYSVTLLNSPVSNALAIPGGYVYVTRQLLALMNNEAELAFVMGHEIGHVAKQHAQKRNTRSTLATLGSAILGAVTGSETLGNLAGQGAQLYTLGFSRDQEREADDLGVRYLARAGYDPLQGPAILAALGAQDRLNAQLTGKGAESEAPRWLRSHPASAERVARVRRDAAKLAAAAGPKAVNRDGFLDAIDGLLYDDDPAQGIVDGPSFRHPGLGIAFDAPRGFALQNNPDAVIATGPGGARAMFAGGRLSAGQDLAEHAASALRQLGAPAQAATERRRINGMDAAIARARVATRTGEVDVAVAAYRWGGDTAYRFVTIAPAGAGAGLDAMLGSLRRLAPGEAGQLRLRRIRVVRVQPGDTVATLARRMAYRDNQAARLMVLNGLDKPRPLTPGERLKLVVYSAR